MRPDDHVVQARLASPTISAICTHEQRRAMGVPFISRRLLYIPRVSIYSGMTSRDGDNLWSRDNNLYASTGLGSERSWKPIRAYHAMDTGCTSPVNHYYSPACPETERRRSRKPRPLFQRSCTWYSRCSRIIRVTRSALYAHCFINLLTNNRDLITHGWHIWCCFSIGRRRLDVLSYSLSELISSTSIAGKRAARIFEKRRPEWLTILGLAVKEGSGHHPHPIYFCGKSYMRFGATTTALKSLVLLTSKYYCFSVFLWKKSATI